MGMLRRLFERYRAWRCGERRIAPAGMRGRVYERKGGGGPLVVWSEPEATISARVYRAATGTWHNLGVISKPKKE